jgi:hypothetical protein
MESCRQIMLVMQRIFTVSKRTSFHSCKSRNIRVSLPRSPRKDQQAMPTVVAEEWELQESDAMREENNDDIHF